MGFKGALPSRHQLIGFGQHLFSVLIHIDKMPIRINITICTLHINWELTF